MRWFLGMWFAPMSFIVAWLALASHDLSFGTFFFSRALYDEVFAIYGAALGLAPESLPPLVVRAILLDSLIVLAIYAFRRRGAIASAVRRWRQSSAHAEAAASPASLSSAP